MERWRERRRRVKAGKSDGDRKEQRAEKCRVRSRGEIGRGKRESRTALSASGTSGVAATIMAVSAASMSSGSPEPAASSRGAW